MPIVPVRNVGQVGIIKDNEVHELPPNAWTDGLNVRFVQNSVAKMSGEANAYSAPSISPLTLVPVRYNANYYWMYAGESKCYVTDGDTHYNVTRTSGAADDDYQSDLDLRWTGGVMGGVAVINNGVNAPQMWKPIGTGQRLQNLTNWPAGATCRSFRPFRNFWLALDYTVGGTRYPQQVRWSSPANPLDVPASWDDTDTTVDAGISNGVLTETGDILVDCLPLRDVNIVYKEHSSYLMQYVQPPFVFGFRRLFSEVGMLTRNCAAAWEGQHFVVTVDDVVVHDGQQAQSVAADRVRRTLRALIDNDNYERAHVARIDRFEEMWFCHPRPGDTWCTRAWCWNWRHNRWYLRTLPGIAHTATGLINIEANLGSWNQDPNIWDEDDTRWEEILFSKFHRGILMADYDSTKLWKGDTGYTFNAVNYNSFIERRGLTFDTLNVKEVNRIYPYVAAADGTVMTISVGGTDNSRDTPVYDEFTYTVGQQDWVDIRARGRFLAIKFEDTTNSPWRLSGYDMELNAVGER